MRKENRLQKLVSLISSLNYILMYILDKLWLLQRSDYQELIFIFLDKVAKPG